MISTPEEELQRKNYNTQIPQAKMKYTAKLKGVSLLVFLLASILGASVIFLLVHVERENDLPFDKLTEDLSSSDGFSRRTLLSTNNIDFDVTTILKEYKSIQLEISKRNEHRRELLTPPVLSYNLPRQTLLSFKVSESPESTGKKAKQKESSSKNVKDEKWCGHFISKSQKLGVADSLYEPLSASNSRVLITGMLSHGLGVYLAITLKNTCGINSVAGLDGLYPNTAKHRIKVLEQRYRLALKSGVILLNHYDDSQLPFVGLQPRGRYSAQDENSQYPEQSLVVDSIVDFNPTHIIHLSSMFGSEEILHKGTFSKAQYDSVEQQDRAREQFEEFLADQGYNRPDEAIPIFPSHIFRHEQSLMSMEQVLQSMTVIQTRLGVSPHLIYASTHELSRFMAQDRFPLSQYAASKLCDEILVNSFASKYGFTNVGLRFASIYGPAGSFGTDIHDMAERATLGSTLPILLPQGSIIEGGVHGLKASASSSKEENQAWWDEVHKKNDVDLLYVEDAAEAILAAMQFYPRKSDPKIFNVGGFHTTPLTQVATLMERELRRRSEFSLVAHLASAYGDGESYTFPTFNVSLAIQTERDITRQHLGWKDSTTLADGVSKTLHWHFYQRYPYGPTLQQVSQTARDIGQLPLHWVVPPLNNTPCTSECSYEGFCLEDRNEKGKRQTIWTQEIIEISVAATDGCAVAMYSANFDSDLMAKHVIHTSERSDNEELENMVCKIMYVRKDSDLVSKLISSIIEKDSNIDDMLAEHNGKLFYKNWKIIWLQDKPRTSADKYFVKMTPLNLFAESVIHVMYIMPSRRYPPGTDEVMSIAKSMLAKRIKAKKKWIGKAPKRFQIVIPQRPSRRAAIMTSYPEVTRDVAKKLRSYVNEEKDVMKYFGHLMLSLDLTEEVPDRTTKSTTSSINKDVYARQEQMSYYDFAYRRLNKDMEYRDLSQYLELPDAQDAHKILKRVEIYPVHSQWVIHDLQLEHGRSIRCDWYYEHMTWDTLLEDASLSYVLAKRSAKDELGIPCGSWVPILNARADNELPRYIYPFEVSPFNRGCSIYSDKVAVQDTHHYGIYAALTRKPLSTDMNEMLLNAAEVIAKRQKIQEKDLSKDLSEDISKLDGMELMATLKEHTALNKQPKEETEAVEWGEGKPNKIKSKADQHYYLNGRDAEKRDEMDNKDNDAEESQEDTNKEVE